MAATRLHLEAREFGQKQPPVVADPNTLRSGAVGVHLTWTFRDCSNDTEPKGHTGVDACDLILFYFNAILIHATDLEQVRFSLKVGCKKERQKEGTSLVTTGYNVRRSVANEQ